MIEFKNLDVGFGSKKILKNLSGTINSGDLIALMGINGVGKSCFLKTLTSLNPILGGELKVSGKSYADILPNEMAKTMAVVLTDKIQTDYLRVSELLSLGLSPHTNFWGALSSEDEKTLQEIVNLLKIESINDRFFSDLSDGQKQKVLLARALAQKPSFLFLDEPTTYLDIPAKIELMKLLKNLSEKNIAVFFSTHDLNLVESVVDQIWLIDSNGVLHKKSPEDMSQSGLLKKNFNL
ncbi:MAG: ABC transporter ATP-binding protein [Bdellovibrionales bacterium]|nr:ABC transporter ATP-binding protein [Bdellovibrionales bacterium]